MTSKNSGHCHHLADRVVSKLKVIETFADERIALTSEGIAYQTSYTRLEYGKKYFDYYQGLKGTAISQCLNEKRTLLLSQYRSPLNLDIGVGSGEFIEAYEARGGDSLGYDVNPFGIDWLCNRNIFFDPYGADSDRVFDSATMWDSLEHLPSPSCLLKMLRAELIFISIPLINDLRSLFNWKHYKPNEHLYYFSESGLEFFMDANGFQLLEKSRMEESCGREDIGTFVFERFNRG